MLKVCIDSNIWISGVLFRGPPASVVTAALNRRFDLILSKVNLEEIERNLLNKFQFSRANTRRLIHRILETADLVEPRGEVKVVPGSHTDNLVLETAILGRARILVTGDKQHLLPRGSHKMAKILDAASFLTILKKWPTPAGRKIVE
jgi:putative PIN family toxin of toxin-antitoxin system